MTIKEKIHSEIKCLFMSTLHSLLFNPIPLDILRFRAKTMPQIKGKQQGGAKLAPT